VLLLAGVLGVCRARIRPTAGFSVDQEGGDTLVSRLVEGGPAHRAGLTIGDRVLRVDSEELRAGSDLEFLLMRRRSGEIARLDILRSGRLHGITITLVPRFSVPLVVLNLVLGLAFWGMGVLVYRKKPHDRAARCLFRGFVVLGAAILMIWPGYPYGGEILGYILPAVFFALYTAAPALVLSFALVYPAERRFLGRSSWVRVALFAPGAVLAVLLEATYFRAILLDSPQAFQGFSRVYRWLQVYVAVFVAASIAALIRSYRASESSEERKRVAWILAGICAGASPFIVLWSLPQALGLPPLIPEEANYAFMLLIPLTFAVSVIKYHALDIEVLISRGLVYVAATVAVAGLYLVVVGIGGHFLGAVTPGASSFVVIAFTLLVALLFAPVRQRIQGAVDRTFFRVRYDYRRATRDFGRDVAVAGTRSEITELLLERVSDVVPVSRLALVEHVPPVGGLCVVASRGLDGDEEHQLSVFLQAKPALLSDLRVPSVRAGRGGLTGVEESVWWDASGLRGLELAIPVVLRGDTRGALLLGGKRSGLRFFDADLELLTALSREAAMATERLVLQETMITERAEREKLEELNRLKSDFVSHVSHELRTPLTSIRWSVQNLLDGIPEEPSPKVAEYLTAVHDSSTHLARMIENLLDVTTIEAGRIDLAARRLRLGEEVETAVGMIRPLADKKKLDVTASVAEELWVWADRDRLQEILANLLDNAVKYSPEGQVVRVEASLAEPRDEGGPRDAGEGLVRVRVIDSGPGIPEDKRHSIFDRFERLGAEDGTPKKGLGLGLFIVRKLVELQGGTVWIDDTPGAGSTFSFTLPGGLGER
jgi:signal transduction histidine kinase